MYLQAFRSHLLIPQPSDDPAAILLISRFHVLFCRTSHVGMLEYMCSRFLCHQFSQPRHLYLRSKGVKLRSNKGSLTLMRKLFGHVGWKDDLSVFCKPWGTWSNAGFIAHNDQDLQLDHEAYDVFTAPLIRMNFSLFSVLCFTHQAILHMPINTCVCVRLC